MSSYSPKYIYQINEINDMISEYKYQLEHTTKYKNVLNELKKANKNTGNGQYQRCNKSVKYTYNNCQYPVRYEDEDFEVYNNYQEPIEYNNDEFKVCSKYSRYFRIDIKSCDTNTSLMFEETVNQYYGSKMIQCTIFNPYYEDEIISLDGPNMNYFITYDSHGVLYPKLRKNT